MKNLFYFTLILLYSCSPNLKNGFNEKGGINEAIMNSINDFSDKSPLFKKDLVFSISERKLDSNLIVISILGRVNKYYPNIRNKIGSNFDDFPTRFAERKNKLFCWYDPNYRITKELISKLSQYKQIDSSLVMKDNRLLGDFLIDDRKKGECYFFCKKNLKKFKKIRTSLAPGYYAIPNVNCDDIITP